MECCNCDHYKAKNCNMKPILFNTEMVRAILDNRKTVTRRVVKLKYSNTHLEMFTNKYGTLLIEKQNEEPGVTTIRNPDGTTTHTLLACVEKTPPYSPGDILYVRETFFEHKGRFYYKADGKHETLAKLGITFKWHPSIHMPREAARIFLRVTDVRVERLRESFFQCGPTIIHLQKEGVDIGEQCRECIEAYGSPCCIDSESECGMLDEVRSSFSDLWDSTIRPGIRALYGWGGNPWVLVTGFERCQKPEAVP